MSSIELLDCTLRDGGHVVNTMFGVDAVAGITSGLVSSGADIIELGYLKDCEHFSGSTTYSSLSELSPYLPEKKPENTKYAVMIEAGKYDLNKLPPSCETDIDIIRVCFFYTERASGIEYALRVKSKGYEVFLQPMNTLGYTKNDILELIYGVNSIQAGALFIVDSYGSMFAEDLVNLYNEIDRTLDKNIKLGLHSHNNLQLSFALIQKFLELTNGNRNAIVDSTCYGIGRGAGNPNTELVMHYLNKCFGKNYDIDEVLKIIDLYISDIKRRKDWGYSIPYLISGICGVHINNVNYLLDNYNLNSADLKRVISSIQRNPEVRADETELKSALENLFQTEGIQK